MIKKVIYKIISCILLVTIMLTLGINANAASVSEDDVVVITNVGDWSIDVDTSDDGVYSGMGSVNIVQNPGINVYNSQNIQKYRPIVLHRLLYGIVENNELIDVDSNTWSDFDYDYDFSMDGDIIVTVDDSSLLSTINKIASIETLGKYKRTKFSDLDAESMVFGVDIRSGVNWSSQTEDSVRVNLNEVSTIVTDVSDIDNVPFGLYVAVVYTTDEETDGFIYNPVLVSVGGTVNNTNYRFVDDKGNVIGNTVSLVPQVLSAEKYVIDGDKDSLYVNNNLNTSILKGSLLVNSVRSSIVSNNSSYYNFENDVDVDTYNSLVEAFNSNNSSENLTALTNFVNNKYQNRDMTAYYAIKVPEIPDYKTWGLDYNDTAFSIYDTPHFQQLLYYSDNINVYVDGQLINFSSLLGNMSYIDSSGNELGTVADEYNQVRQNWTNVASMRVDFTKYFCDTYNGKELVIEYGVGAICNKMSFNVNNGNIIIDNPTMNVNEANIEGLYNKTAYEVDGRVLGDAKRISMKATTVPLSGVAAQLTGGSVGVYEFDNVDNEYLTFRFLDGTDSTPLRDVSIKNSIGVLTSTNTDGYIKEKYSSNVEIEDLGKMQRRHSYVFDNIKLSTGSNLEYIGSSSSLVQSIRNAFNATNKFDENADFYKVTVEQSYETTNSDDTTSKSNVYDIYVQVDDNLNIVVVNPVVYDSEPLDILLRRYDITKLPVTGGSGTSGYTFIISSSLLILFSLFIIIRRRVARLERLYEQDCR